MLAVSVVLRPDGILRYRPFKTQGTSGVLVELPIDVLFNGRVRELLNKYGGYPPVFSDPLVNRGLKIVQGLAKISKPLTAHVGRHTFLTHIAMKTGNVFTTMQLGGLVKIETAQQYIHVAESISRIGGLGNVEW